MKRRYLTLLLVAVMMASTFMGCNNTTKGSNAEKADSNISNINPAGVFPVAKKKITITAMVSLLPSVSDMEKNDFTKWLEQKTNIHLDMTVVPSDGYDDKLKVALASGNYPEIIMTDAANSNADVVSYGIDQKIYIPLNKYIDKYAINLKKRLAEMPEIKQGMIAPDGNIYTLPTFEGAVGHVAVSYKSWINTAWLQKLNLKMPTTTEEFKKVLMAFKNDDPNGNGKKDEVPMSGAINTWAADPYLFLLNSFDYYDGNTLLKLKDNKFTFCADTDGFKEGLKYIHDLYANGLIDPASLTQDQAQLLQLGSAQPTVLGSFTSGHVAMGIDNNNIALSKQYNALLPLKGSNGYQGTPVTTKQTVNGGSFAITDKCKNPAAAIRMMDLLYDTDTALSMRFGPKGVAWTDPDAGAKGVTGLPAIVKMLNQNNSNTPMSNSWAGATSYGFEKDTKEKMQFSGDIYSPSNYEARLIKITNDYIKFKADADQIMPMWSDVDTATKLTNDFTPINDYVKASIVQFITGKKNVDKDWDSYISGLNKLGYKDYIAAYQKAYLAKK